MQLDLKTMDTTCLSRHWRHVFLCEIYKIM